MIMVLTAETVENWRNLIGIQTTNASVYDAATCYAFTSPCKSLVNIIVVFEYR